MTITTASLAPAQRAEASVSAITIGALVAGISTMFGVAITNNSSAGSDFADYVANSGASDTLKSIITRGVGGTLMSLCVSDELIALVKAWLVSKGFDLLEGIVDSASNIVLNTISASGTSYVNINADFDVLTSVRKSYNSIGSDGSKPYLKYMYNSSSSEYCCYSYFDSYELASRRSQYSSGSYWSDDKTFVLCFYDTPTSSGYYDIEYILYNSDGTVYRKAAPTNYHDEYRYSDGSYYRGGANYSISTTDFVLTSTRYYFATNIPFVVVSGSSMSNTRYSELRYLLEDCVTSYNFDSVTYDIGSNIGSYNVDNVNTLSGMTVTQSDLQALTGTVSSTLSANENDDGTYAGNIASLVASAVAAKLEAIQLANDTTDKIEEAEKAEAEAIANSALLENSKEQTGLLSSILGFLQSILDRLIPIDTWGEWMSSIVSGVGDVVASVGSVVANLVSIETWTGWFADIKQGFIDLGANIKQGIVDLVDSVVDIFVPDTAVIESRMNELIADLKYKFNFTSSLNSIKGMFDNERPVEDIEGDYNLNMVGKLHLTFLDTSYLVQGISYFRSVIRGFLVLLLALFHIRHLMAFINQDSVTRGESEQSKGGSSA